MSAAPVLTHAERKKQEIENVQQMLKNLNEAPAGSPEKVTLMRDLFAYLATTQIVLTSPTFRKTVRDKVTEFSTRTNPEKIEVLKPGVAAFCERLQNEFKEYVEGCAVFGVASKIPPPPPPPPPTPAYKVLGSGSYGAVVKPALPNINATGAVVATFPGMVSKVMKNKDEFDDAVNAMKRIHDVIPALSYNFIPYTKSFTVRNMPNVVQRELDAEFGIVDDYEPLYVARMQDFGTSIRDIYKYSDSRTTFHNLDERTFCREFLRLFRVVKNIKDAGYVHGDIRRPNVMCDLTTGRMTIIDFDLFSTAENFRQSHSYYKHLPPEFALFAKDERVLREWKYQLQHMVGTAIQKELQDADWVSSHTPHVYDSHAEVAYVATNAVLTAVITTDETALTTLRKKCMDTLDMYSLATVFYQIMRDIPHVSFKNFLYTNLFPAILEANPLRRITVEEAIDRLTDYARENVLDMELGEAADPTEAFARMIAAFNLMGPREAKSGGRRRKSRKASKSRKSTRRH